MNIYKATEENIRKAAGIIKSGGLVAFPTETVYGLGANGLNPEAVAKIFEAKQRPTFNPLILHIRSFDQLNLIANSDDLIVEKLIKKFWPGPLTLVLKKKEIVPEIVTAGNLTVAVRMPANETAQKLIDYSGVPIAAPSANAFGFLSPTTARHVANQLGEKVEMILDGGNTEVGIESTIIEISDEGIFLLRPGGLPVEEIEKLTGKLNIKTGDAKPNSPGQLPFHYSPKIPLRFFDEVTEEEIRGKKKAALFFREPENEKEYVLIKCLSPEGKLRQAAANLFAYLYELEASGAEIILAEKPPSEGLGIAILDRLQRASKRY